MKTIILTHRKTGSSAVMMAVHHGGGLSSYSNEPKNLTKHIRKPDIVIKKVMDSFDDMEMPYLEMATHKFLLVRDPRDALISKLLYAVYPTRHHFKDDVALRRWVQVLRRKREDPSSLTFHMLVRAMKQHTGYDALIQLMQEQDKLIFLYKTFKDTVPILKYEDWVAGNAQHIEEYLGFAIPPVELDGKFRRVTRRTGVGDHANWFAESDYERYGVAFRLYDMVFGYEATPKANPQVILKEHADGYVKRILNRLDLID